MNCEPAGVRMLYDQPKRGTANSRVNFATPKTAAECSSNWSSPATGN